METPFKTISTGKWCEECGEELFVDTLEVCGSLITINKACKCRAEKERSERNEKIEKGRTLLRAYWLSKAGIKSRLSIFSFKDYMPREGQEDGFRVARKYAEDYLQSPPDKGLLLVGPVGSGKSMLAAMVVKYIVEGRTISDDLALKAESELSPSLLAGGWYSCPGIMFSTGAHMLEKIRSTYDEENTSESKVTGEYAKRKLLVLDDIGAEKLTDWGREKLFEIIDHRYNEYLPTILTTNLTPRQLKEVVGDRIYDRVRAMCAMVTLTAKSQRVTATG